MTNIRVRNIFVALAITLATPITQAGDLHDDIREALRTRGNVDTLAATSLSTPADDANTLIAQSRLAIELGDLDRAIALLDRAIKTADKPSPDSLRLFAQLNELTAHETVAETAWRRLAEIDPTHADEPRLRIALLALDAGEFPKGERILATLPGYTAGVAANYFRRFSLENTPLGDAPTGVRLLSAAAAFNAGKWADAQKTYESVIQSSENAADRQFAASQAVAVARKSGTLPQFVDRWKADPAIRAEQFLPLAIAFRETGRSAELITWWKQRVSQERPQAALFSERLVAEIAETADDAATVLADAVAHDPQPDRSLKTAVRILLRRNETATADTILLAAVEQADTNTKRLISLGTIAQASGRDDLANQVADKLIAAGKEAAVRGLILRAKIARRNGNKASIETALTQAAAAAPTPALAVDVAVQLDAAGLDGKAIELLQSLTARGEADEDTLIQLAAMLAANRREREALDILDRLRRTTESPGAAAQASQRMLDIAGATKGYDRLVASLRAAIATGTATSRDVNLLADTYLAMRKTEAAIGVLQSTTVLDEKMRRQRLATILLRTKEYRRATKVLWDIVVAEPGDAVPTLEQIASVAVEQKRADEATRVVAEIAKRTQQSPAADELMGGIYDRLGWPGEAANRYRRAIAVNEGRADTAEDWLLWSAAILKDGRPDVASHRLQALCVEADTDALFTVAVDALANFDVPPPALKAVRREAIVRAARRPTDVTLTHLISDLSDELSDAAGSRFAREVAVCISPDERSQLLRDLAERATAEGREADAIGNGSSLLAMDADFPPQIFLDLGRQLLKANRTEDAHRAFRRAIDGPGGDTSNNASPTRTNPPRTQFVVIRSLYIN